MQKQIKNFYGITRNRKLKQILLNQCDYIAECLEMAAMGTCAGSKTKGSMFVTGVTIGTEEEFEDMNEIPYRNLTGALQYLACHARPDIAFEAATLGKYNTKPTMSHWNALKQLLRYLKYTVEDELVLGGGIPLVLCGFSDSGFATLVDNGKMPRNYVRGSKNPL
jgi:hypothetical protein